MKNILVLGAGQSTAYLVSHLLKHADENDWFVTVCDRDGQLAASHVAGHPRGQAITFDVNDATSRTALIKKASIVVNMLTRPFQHLLALECLNCGVHMVTASYEDPSVHAMDADAHRRNILILNELGLDPGIDHMIAMSLIQSVRGNGGEVRSFRSYGGGLPAPDSKINPLRYMITWNPRNVLLAGEDGAIFKEDGKVKLLPFYQIFEHTWTVDIEGIGTFEAYPNRDSLSYESALGLGLEHTIIRGTLRYPGWSETWQQIVRLGLTNEVLRVPHLKDLTYRELTEMCIPHDLPGSKLEHQVASYLGISPTGTIMQNLKWLGLFSNEKIGIEAKTVSEAMIKLLKAKLRRPPDVRDMVVLYHELEAQYSGKDGRSERITSTFVEYGEPEGFTAIARSVGLPIAIAVRLILNGRIPLTGCHIPTHAAIYGPILEELETQGFRFRIKSIPMS